MSHLIDNYNYGKNLAIFYACTYHICTCAFDTMDFANDKIIVNIEYFGDSDVYKRLKGEHLHDFDDQILYGRKRYNMNHIMRLLAGDRYAYREHFRSFFGQLMTTYKYVYGDEYVAHYSGRPATMMEYLQFRFYEVKSKEYPEFDGFYGNEQDVAVLIAYFKQFGLLEQWQYYIASNLPSEDYEKYYKPLLKVLFPKGFKNKWA